MKGVDNKIMLFYFVVVEINKLEIVWLVWLFGNDGDGYVFFKVVDFLCFFDFFVSMEVVMKMYDD